MRGAHRPRFGTPFAKPVWQRLADMLLLSFAMAVIVMSPFLLEAFIDDGFGTTARVALLAVVCAVWIVAFATIVWRIEIVAGREFRETLGWTASNDDDLDAGLLRHDTD